MSSWQDAGGYSPFPKPAERKRAIDVRQTMAFDGTAPRIRRRREALNHRDFPQFGMGFGLKLRSEGRYTSSQTEQKATMSPLVQFLKFTVTGALGATFSIFSTFASADEMVQNLGPVRAHEGLLASVGSMRLIAFFEPIGGRCAVNAVFWDTLGADPGESAKRVQVRIGPGETINIETARQESLKLQCGGHASNLAIIDVEGLSASGITAQPPGTTR